MTLGLTTTLNGPPRCCQGPRPGMTPKGLPWAGPLVLLLAGTSPHPSCWRDGEWLGSNSSCYRPRQDPTCNAWAAMPAHGGGPHLLLTSPRSTRWRRALLWGKATVRQGAAQVRQSSVASLRAPFTGTMPGLEQDTPNVETLRVGPTQRGRGSSQYSGACHTHRKVFQF